MFFYLFKNRLFCLIRQKSFYLFSLGLPIFLSLLFLLGINNLSNRENNTIRLGIIGNESSMTEYLKGVVKENGESLFYLKYTDKWEGEDLLKKGDIKGLIKTGEVPILYILEEGYDQTRISYYFTRYGWLNKIDKITTQNIINEDITESGYDAIVNRASDIMPNREKIFFYNLFVLILLLGARLGFNEVKIILQERSFLGLRIMTAPKSRSSICFINLLAAFTIHLIGVVLSLTFITKLMKIDLLIHMVPLVIVSVVTSIFGFSIGTFICVIIKANNKVQSTILNLFLICGSISAGLFDSNIKYLILEKAPLLRYLNPFIVVYDLIYSIASSENLFRINLNFLVLIIITLILSGYSFLIMKRRDYASI